MRSVLSTATCMREVQMVTNMNIVSNRKTYRHLHKSVLVRTFRTWTIAKEKCGYVRVTFDECIQRTFIRESVNRKMQPKMLRQDDVTINVYGDLPEQRSRARRLVQVVPQCQCTIRSRRLQPLKFLLSTRISWMCLLSANSYVSSLIRPNAWQRQ